MKKIVFLLVVVILCGCSSSSKGYSEKRGLMILDNTEQPRNAKFHSSSQAKKKKQTRRKLKKGQKKTIKRNMR
jgi:hypothetical protein